MKTLLKFCPLIAILAFAGCDGMSPSENHILGGAAIGTVGGTAIGALAGNAGAGALIGAGVGTLGGVLYDRDYRYRHHHHYYYGY